MATASISAIAASTISKLSLADKSGYSAPNSTKTFTTLVFPEARSMAVIVAPFFTLTFPFFTINLVIVTPASTTSVFSAVEAVASLMVVLPPFEDNVTVVFGILTFTTGASSAPSVSGRAIVMSFTDEVPPPLVALSSNSILAPDATLWKAILIGVSGDCAAGTSILLLSPETSPDTVTAVFFPKASATSDTEDTVWASPPVIVPLEIDNFFKSLRAMV